MLGTMLFGVFGAVVAPQAEEPAILIELARPTHFPGTDGRDVLVPAGTFRVEPRDAALVLMPQEGGSELVLAAASGAHEEPITVPTALSIPVDQDEHHLVWLRPGGGTLDAKGSPSGIQSRGPGIVTAATVKKFRTAASTTAAVKTLIPTKPCSVSTRPAGILASPPVPPTHYATISPLTLASSLLFDHMQTNTGAAIMPLAVDEQSNILGTMLTLKASSGTYSTRLTAPVHLPDGAVIREIALVVQDTLSEDVRVGLLAHRLSLGTSDLGTLPPGDSLIDVSMTSECASVIGNKLLAVSNLAIPVVNRDRGYLVYVFMMATPTPGHKISPIRIGYTLP